MNYITKLRKENELLKRAIDDLTAYVNSSKFAVNPMVNKNDINLRLGEYRNLFHDNELDWFPKTPSPREIPTQTELVRL